MGKIIFSIGPTDGIPVLLSPLHPLMHGGFRIHCDVDSDVIVAAEVEIGHVHRSAEKLFEVRDYRAGAMLANRHIWTSPTAGEYAFVLAVEELLALPISPRADQLRLVFSELDRILSHLAFLLPVLVPGGMSTVREDLADFLSLTTGSRMHHHVIRIGGVAVDLDEQRIEQLTAILDRVDVEVDQLRSSELLAGFVGIGGVATEMIGSYGITGPIARSAGVLSDRRTTGYGAYRDFNPVVGASGDGAARLEVLIEEVLASRDLVAGTLSTLGVGELLTRTPKNLRVPEGESHREVEGALGCQGISLFSDGGLAPTRVRLRTPSLAALHALEAVLVGVAVEQLPRLLASWPALPGDADR